MTPRCLQNPEKAARNKPLLPVSTAAIRHIELIKVMSFVVTLFVLLSTAVAPVGALTCSGSSLGAQPSVTDPTSSIASCTLTGSVSFAVPSMPPVATAPSLAIAVTASTLASGVMLEIRGSGSAAVLATHGPLQALIQGNAYTNGYIYINGAFPPRSNITIFGNTGRCAFPVLTYLDTALLITQLFIAEFSTVTVRNNTFEGVGNLYPRGIAIRSNPIIKHYSAVILDGNRLTATGATGQGEGIGLCQQASVIVDNHSRYEVTRNAMTIHNPGIWILGIFTEGCTTTISIASTFLVEGNTLQGTGTQLRAIALDNGASFATTVSGGSVYAVRDNTVDVTATTRFALLEHNGPLSVGTGSRYTVSNNRAFSRGGAAPSPNYLLGLVDAVGVSGAGSSIQVLGNALECTGSNGRLIQEGATLTASSGGRFVVRDNALGCGTAIFSGGLSAPPPPYVRGPEPVTSTASYVYVCNNSVTGKRVSSYTSAFFSGASVLARCHIVTRSGSGVATTTASPSASAAISRNATASLTFPTPPGRTQTHSARLTLTMKVADTPTTARIITKTKSHASTLTPPLPPPLPPPSTSTAGITNSSTAPSPLTTYSTNATVGASTTPMSSAATTTVAAAVTTPTSTNDVATTTTGADTNAPTSTATTETTTSVPAAVNATTAAATVSDPATTGTAGVTSASGSTWTPPSSTTATTATTAAPTAANPPLQCQNLTAPTLDVLSGSIVLREADTTSATHFLLPPGVTVAVAAGASFTIAFTDMSSENTTALAGCTLLPPPSALSCTVSSQQWATNGGVETDTLLEAAVPAAVGGCPAMLRLRVVVSGSGAAHQSSVFLAAARAVLPAAVLVYVFDPTAAEPAMATAVLLADCAAPVAGADVARVAKYLLNPLAGVGPTSAGAALAVLVAGVWVVHAAVAVLWARREAAAGRRSFAGALRRVQFPAAPFAVSVAMGPGVAWGCGAAINAGGHAWAAVAVCVLFLVCLPAAAALVVFRGPAHTFIHHPAPASWVRRLIRPVGAWYARSEGAAETPAVPLQWGIAASARPGFRLAPVLAAWLLAVLVAAVAVAPPASASCAARHYALAAIFWTAAVLVAAARPHTVPGVSLLSAAGMASLGAACAAVAAQSQTATFAFVLLCALFTITRTGLMLLFALWPRMTVLDGDYELSEAPRKDENLVLSVAVP